MPKYLKGLAPSVVKAEDLIIHSSNLSAHFKALWVINVLVLYKHNLIISISEVYCSVIKPQRVCFFFSGNFIMLNNVLLDEVLSSKF